MSKSVRLFVAVVMTLGMCSLSMAAPTVQLQSGNYQASQGGEFTAHMTGDSLPGLATGSVFQTFCLEHNESISFGQTYWVKLNTAAVLGGVSGGPVDPLDPRTAWLYNEFSNGTLQGYFDNPAGRKNSAAALQNAIWYIEQEITTLPTGLATSFYNQANASSWAQSGTIGDIRILNNYADSNYTQNAQDVLCRVTPVPAPAAIGLVGLGTIGVGMIRRRAL